MSLKNPQTKMSKSDPDPRSRILLSDSDETIRTKIKMALTDCQGGVSFDAMTRPGVSNLLSILASVQEYDLAPSQQAAAQIGLSMRAFKEHVADEIIKHIGPIRGKYLEILADKHRLVDTMVKGAESARKNASETLHMVYKTVGLR